MVYSGDEIVNPCDVKERIKSWGAVAGCSLSKEISYILQVH